ncbi:ankyrin repeat and SAM domain-containing protein 6 [Cucumis melo var. makuwa]|uniref:Ankyrin repeat and SAM domain-containing protein 6 n=1 Tax=Cucumis melo var. makuwa TaxID=1194695 RepID=A0A5A7SPS1_CUCMM|nr:ankyrin repeat and SAM domain-containing protein 6 [Cucumis melo var. makuwa]
MYADRLEADNHRSIKDRLNGNSSDLSARRRPITGKRQRQDDKWEHDLYENDEPQTSNRRVGARDLRLKLQKKSQQQSGNAPFSGVRDLREKLSGTMKPQAAKNDPPKPKLEVTKPPRKNDAIEAHPSTTQKAVAKSATRKNAAQKSDTSVDDFLQSLGLEKYSITFQAEEVDMTALVHMGDDDLKALGVPMFSVISWMTASFSCSIKGERWLASFLTGTGMTATFQILLIARYCRKMNHNMPRAKKEDPFGIGIKSMNHEKWLEQVPLAGV